MFFTCKSKLVNAEVEALHRSQAVIFFSPDGTILDANENFLNAMGYTLAEIKGKHHRLFVDADYANSADYALFWDKLTQGTFISDEFHRHGKDGKDVWIQASYNPLISSNGNVLQIVKYATDITAQKQTDADYKGQIAAIGKSQAVIEFSTDGTILNANENFLNTTGYTLEEIKGKHHCIFVSEKERNSTTYLQFWKDLALGNHRAGEYKRIAKDGSEIWINASYNPILDVNGNPCKVYCWLWVGSSTYVCKKMDR